MQALVHSTTDHYISWEWYDMIMNFICLNKQTCLIVSNTTKTHRQFSAALRDFCHSYHIDYDDPRKKKKKKNNNKNNNNKQIWSFYCVILFFVQQNISECFEFVWLQNTFDVIGFFFLCQWVEGRTIMEGKVNL